MEQIIGSRIKELRAQYNLDVYTFAERCCLSPQVIYAIENGKTTKPHISTLAKIANTLGSNVNWILYGTGEMLATGIKVKFKEEKLPRSISEDETYAALKTKNALLESELEKLWQLVTLIMDKRIQLPPKG